MTGAGTLAASLAEVGRRSAGAQLVVSLGDVTIVDEAFGTARPGVGMTNDTIHSLFCLTKPIVAAAACEVARVMGVSLDAPLRDTSPRIHAMFDDGTVSLRDVLSHAAGLHPVHAAEVMFQPRCERVAATERAEFAHGWAIGRDHAYSEFQGWNVVRVWLEDVSGRPFGECVRHFVLDPWNVPDVFFGVTDAQWRDVRMRLGVHYEIDGEHKRPLLHDLLRKHVDDPAMQAIGGYGSARGVAAFYRAVLAARWTDRTGVARVMSTPTAAPVVDPTLRTELSFSFGCMTDLGHAFGPTIGPRAFGHLGLLGHSFAFADPDVDLVAVLVPNGFLVDDDERLRVRASIVDAIYSDALVGA